MPKEKGPTMKTESRRIPAFIRKKCMACKICVDDCPVSCIGVEASGTVKDPHGYPFLEDETLCTHCGQCAENCPVAAIQTFSDQDDVIRRANDTEYGLVAYVFSEDMKRALQVCERLEYGMVGLNRGLVSDPAAPFGGVKQSGLGREGGHEGMLEFMETQYISASW